MSCYRRPNAALLLTVALAAGACRPAGPDDAAGDDDATAAAADVTGKADATGTAADAADAPGTPGADASADAATAADANSDAAPAASSFPFLLPTASITCGGACPAGTACVAGACKPVACTPTMPAGATHVLRIHWWSMMPAGCDQTGDGKPDNSVGALIGSIFGNPIDPLDVDTTDYGMALLVVGPAVAGPVTLLPVHGEVLANGTFAVSADSVDTSAPAGPCPFREAWPATVSASGAVTANYDFSSGWASYPFGLSADWGTSPVHDFQLTLQLGKDATGAPSTLVGELCGALAHAEVMARFTAMLKALVAADPSLSILDLPGIAATFYVADVDTDGDGTLDAVSFGHAIKADALVTVGFQ